MAKKKEEPKTVLERKYVVPLRREWLKTARYKRAKKAATGLRQFLVRHMKPGKDEKGNFQVKILKELNEYLWKHGIKNPPTKVKIIAVKDDKGVVKAQLEGVPIEKKKEEPKKKKEKKIEEKKEETKEEKAKVEEKAELEAIKKEKPKAPEKQPTVPKKVEARPTAPKNQ